MRPPDNPPLRRRAAFLDLFIKLLEENTVGNPVPFFLYKKSSGNRIRHIYLLKKIFDFGEINNVDAVIEIGGGYGCMAKIFEDINPNVDEIELFIKKISNTFNNDYDVILTSGSRKIDNLVNYISSFKKVDDVIFKKDINKKVITYFHNISFEDLAFTVSNSALIICCEGAISHLSNNFNIPTLALYEKKRFQHNS